MHSWLFSLILLLAIVPPAGPLAASDKPLATLAAFQILLWENWTGCHRYELQVQGF